MHKLYLLLLFSLISQIALSQGIQGDVYSSEGELLPYATIFIRQLETGTSTNEDGSYEIKLDPGAYELVFQHMGYQTVVKQVEISNTIQKMDVEMPLQTIQLKEVQVRAGKEDPAYTVIRKAIAKSKFHALQVQSYTAQVYIKGAGRVKDVPFFLEKPLEKEGVDSSTVYLTESVSEITFEQPNTLKERVISIRTIGENNSASPNNYITGSFYEPEVAGAISPLSPHAFAYYKFRFEGSFYDRDYEVNKIRVIPRSRGDNVFNGYIYIVDDLWSIHSLNFITYKQGFKINVKQIYAPVEESVWMPVTHQIKVGGKIFGIELEYKYLATASNYDVRLNPDLKVDVVVVDEKIEKELAEALKKEERLEIQSTSDQDATKVFRNEQRLTRKALRKALKNYEKELEKQEESPEIIANISMTIDSTAYKSDSAYWSTIRPVPLSEMEVKSYQKLDSMVTAENRGEEGKDTQDTTKAKSGGKRSNFSAEYFLSGTTLRLGDRSSLEYKSPLLSLNFNTVEGIYFNLPLIYRHRLKKNRSIEVSPVLRYAVARKQLVGKFQSTFYYTTQGEQNALTLEGGRFVYQLNEAEPIAPVINSFYTLLYKRNFLKLYEKDYAKLYHSHHFGDVLGIQSSLEWAERHQLMNNTDFSFNKKREDQVFTSNAPANVELRDTGFPTHQAFVAAVEVEYKPFLKYKVEGGNKQLINKSSPIFYLTYRRGFPQFLSSDVNFDHLEVGVKDQIKIGIRGRLDYNLYAGSFLNNRQLYFPDFQHFMGNRTVLQVSDPVASFRLLDYYRYSTGQNYLAGHLYYQFRKLLLTQIFEVRILGLKENLVLNYLKSELSPHYLEVGYSLDNIFRFLRLEALSSFTDGQYQDFGFRIGISTNLENLLDL